MARLEDMAPSGARYVDGDEREPYMGRAMIMHRVINEPNARYGPRWVVEAALLDSGEIIALGLAANPYRDAQLGAARAALIAGDEIDPVVLYRDTDHPGKNGTLPWAFRSATDAEIEAAGVLAAGEDDNAPEPVKGKGKA
jgi:hypothetical protein